MTTDLFVGLHEGLCQVHRTLLDAFTRAFAVPDAHAAARFLLAHHAIESEVLFTGLRRAGRLRSTDVAFLDARDREHHALHRIVEHILASNEPSVVIALAGETLGLLAAHTAEEEAGLAPDRLRTIVDEPGLAAILQDADRARDRLLASGQVQGIR